jgi:EmrB/QacA subfamily drug resistance transporter
MTQALKTHSPWLGLSLVLLSFVIRLMNATITSTELPALESDLGVSGPTAELTMTLFLAVAGALVAPMGMLADRYGRVRVFSYGAVAMIVANAGSALAPNFGVLLVTRVAEAVAFPARGAASLALVASTFTDAKQRSRAFAAYGACYGVAVALAGVLGGIFATDLSWRWSFAMNIPFLLIALIGVNRLLRRDDDPHPERELDWWGTAALTVGVSGLLFGIQRLPETGFDAVTVGLLVTAAVGLVGFLVWERYWSRAGHQVLLDSQLFASASFPAAVSVSGLMMFGAFALFTVMPLFWGLVAGATPLQVGIGLLPLGAGWSLGAILAAPLGARWGDRLAVALALLTAAAMAAAAAWRLPDDGAIGASAAPLAVLGIGLGVAYARINQAGLHAVPDRLTGLGSGLLIGTRFLAAALGAAVLSQLMMWSATSLARDTIAADSTLTVEQRDQAQHAVTAAARGRYGPLLAVESRPSDATAAQELRDSYTDAARGTLLAAGLFLLLGAAATRGFPGRTSRDG